MRTQQGTYEEERRSGAAEPTTRESSLFTDNGIRVNKNQGFDNFQPFSGSFFEENLGDVKFWSPPAVLVGWWAGGRPTLN